MRPLQPGQMTLDGKRGSSHVANHINLGDTMQDDRNISPEEGLRQPSTAHPTNGAPHTHGNGNIVFKHYEPRNNARRGEPEDIEMT